jgi:hypothetical protein
VGVLQYLFLATLLYFIDINRSLEAVHPHVCRNCAAFTIKVHPCRWCQKLNRRVLESSVHK